MDGPNEKGPTEDESAGPGVYEHGTERVDRNDDAPTAPTCMPSFEAECAPLVVAGLTLIPLHRWDARDSHKLGKDGKPLAQGKMPLHSKWTETTYTAATVIATAEKAGLNVGVRLSGTDLLVVDVDPRNFRNGVDSFEKLKADTGLDENDYPVVRTGSGGLHVYMRRPVGFEAAGKLDDYPGIDFKTSGQVVAPGSLHPDTGKPYVGVNMGLLALEQPLPDRLLEVLDRSRDRSGLSDGAARFGEIGPEQLKANLDQVPVDSVTDYDTWVQLAMACHAATAGEGLDEFTEWSTAFTGDKVATPREIADKWQGFSSTGDGVTSALLYKLVHEAGGTVIDRRPAEDDFAVWVCDDKPSRTEKRWHFITLAELEAMPPPNWLIDGIIQEETLVAIYGAPESGKSFLAIDMVMAVATSRPWHGRDVMQGAVLYIAAEGARGLGKRVNAWKVEHGISDVPFHLMCEDLNLTSEKEAAAFCREMVEALGPLRMIVIDTLNQTATGADENSAQDMGRYVKSMKRMRDETGATVAVVHHSGKDSAKGMRGSTALLGGFDTTIEVVRPNEDGSVINVRVKKQKDGEREPPIHFEMVKTADSLVLRVTKQSINESDGAFVRGSLVDWIGQQVAASGGSMPFKALLDARVELTAGKSRTVREKLMSELGEGFDNAKPCSDGTRIWLKERESGRSKGELTVLSSAGAAS